MTMNEENKIHKFLDAFQKLEDIINERGDNKAVFRDALTIFAQRNSFVKSRMGEILDLYALRNVYSHMQRGKYLAALTNEAVSSLQTILETIKYPPTTLDVFGPNAKFGIFEASVDDLTRNVVSEMTKNEYTHVPVWDGDKMIGVFAYNSFFQWVNYELNARQSSPYFEKEHMSDVNRRYLNNPVVRFQFVKEDDPAHEIPSIFQKSTEQQRRLDCVLITKNGQRDEKITGIITPWDLYKLS